MAKETIKKSVSCDSLNSVTNPLDDHCELSNESKLSIPRLLLLFGYYKWIKNYILNIFFIFLYNSARKMWLIRLILFSSIVHFLQRMIQKTICYSKALSRIQSEPMRKITMLSNPSIILFLSNSPHFLIEKLMKEFFSLFRFNSVQSNERKKIYMIYKSTKYSLISVNIWRIFSYWNNNGCYFCYSFFCCLKQLLNILMSWFDYNYNPNMIDKKRCSLFLARLVLAIRALRNF